MNRTHQRHWVERVAEPATPEERQRLAAECEQCRRQLPQLTRFDEELATAGRGLTGPNLPSASFVVAAGMNAEPWSHLHRLVLGAAVAGVLVLAVVAGGVIASLVDRTPTNLGGSPAPEPTSPYRHSRQEFLTLVGECVRDEGFASVRVDVRESKIDFANRADVLAGGPEAVRVCIVRVDPARHEPPPPRSERQLRQLYEFRVAQARCLDSLGYHVDDPPILELFLAEGAEWEPAPSTSAPIDDQLRCEYIPQRPDFLDW